MNKKRKPNLYLVGCPRSGTTTLYELLDSHQEIYMSPVKGPNFFGDGPNHSFPQYHKNKKKYLSLYYNRREKYLGDASHYFASEKAAHQIKDFNPNAKILIILRKPIDMAISHYKAGLIPKDDAFFKVLKRNELSLNLLKKRLNYDENVSRYFNLFGKKNVCVLLFYDLKKNPEKIKKEIAKFLKIDSRFFSIVPRSNVAKEIRRPCIQKMVHLIPSELRVFIKSITPYDLLFKIKNLLSELASGNEIKVSKNIVPKEIILKNNIETKKIGEKINRELDFWIEDEKNYKILINQTKKQKIKKNL